MKKLLVLSIWFTAVFSQTSPEDFDSLSALNAARVAPDSLREALFSAYSDALGNWRELSDFVDFYADDSAKLADAIWLVNIMPHLDRLLATAEILREHLDYSYLVREEAPWKIPEGMFRPYILAYRLSYEPMTAWRGRFYGDFSRQAFERGNVVDAARFVNSWIYDEIDTAGWEFFGGMQSPEQTVRRGSGNRGEIASLATAILKSLGIPSRNAAIRSIRGRGSSMSWVEVYDAESERWIPLYPDAPERFGDFSYPSEKYPDGITVVNVTSGFEYDFNTAEYSPTGVFKGRFTRAGRPAAGWEHFSIGVFGDGAIWPLDEIGAEADSAGVFEFELAVGGYFLQCGTRDNTGSVWVQAIPLTISEGETTTVEIDVAAPQYLESQPESGVFPVFTLTDLNGAPFSYTQIKAAKPTLILILDPGAEPSVRAKTAIDALDSLITDSLRVIEVVAVEDRAACENYRSDRTALVDDGGALAMALLGYGDLSALRSEALPAVLFVEGGELRFEVLSKGYNTALKGVIEDRMALWFSR